MPNGCEQVMYLDCGGAGPVPARNFSTRRTAGRAHAFGKGRVFHSPLGRDLGSLQAPGARQLYLQATRWAAGMNNN
jgi:hypothetical protein